MSIYKNDLTVVDLELKLNELNDFLILSVSNNEDLKIEFSKYLTSALKIIQKQKEDISKFHIEFLELKIELMQVKEELNNRNIMRHCMK